LGSGDKVGKKMPTESFALEVPQSDIEPRYRTHEDFSTAIKSGEIIIGMDGCDGGWADGADDLDR
jgi:hypothetical protein